MRQPVKNTLPARVIGHLHIMLELIAVALTLIVGRWFDFKRKLHHWAMPLMIVGTLIVVLRDLERGRSCRSSRSPT